MGLVIVLLIVVAAVWWTKRKKAGKPQVVNYLKDAHLLPKVNDWQVLDRPWWPATVVSKKNIYFEKVNVKSLSRLDEPVVVGSEIFGREYPKGELIFDSYGGAFDAREGDDRINTIRIGSSGNLRRAFDENRLSLIVREIDEEAREVSIVLVAFDRPLPWHLPKGHRYQIPKRSFYKLAEKANDISELDALLNTWWDKREQRQNSPAGS